MSTRETFRMTIDMSIDDHTRLKTMSALYGKPMRTIIAEALDVFYKQQKHKAPKKRKANQPNAETRKVLDEIERGEGLLRCGSLDDFFKKFGI